ncbi:MAG TPA: ABC transporter ATP-binding protein, partial [Chroococcales cyanobacterium]
MNLKNNAIVFLFSRGWQYAGRCRPLLVVYIIMFALAKGIELTEPYVIGRMLNDIQVDLGGGLGNTNKILSDVGRYLLLLGAISLGLWAMHGPARIIEQFVAFQIRSNFKSDLFRRLTCLPMRWQREHHSGESIDKINNATAAMSAFFQTTFWLVYMAVRITGTLAILFCLMPIAGWAAVFTTVLAIMTIALFDKVLGEQLCELNRKDNLVASAIHDYASNITSVITLRLEKRTFDEVRRRVFSSQRLFTKNAALTELKWAIISLQVTAVTLIVMFLYVHSNLSARHLILAGTFFTLFEYMRSLGVFYDAFANIYGTIDRQAAALRSVDTINEAYNASDLTESNADLSRSWKEIEVRNLNFTYEDEKCKSHHLNDLCIKLERGKSIAIVGESGSGKSTLLSVLRGLQKPESVEVTADGVKLPQDLRHLSHSTTLLPQDPEIFADTIRFNISFGVEADDDELMSVLQLSKF